MAKLTNEELEKRVYERSLHTCHYISGYENKDSNIQVRCEIHDYIFTTRYGNVDHSTRKHYICPKCKKENHKKKKVEVVCDYCGKIFYKKASRIGRFNFCCRECKDSAQRLNSGGQFNEMRPAHYKEGIYVHYRKLALQEYAHKCAVCGWDEDEDILEVHHIDENRNNNNLSNLIILCPICHKKLSMHKYVLENNKIIKIK